MHVDLLSCIFWSSEQLTSLPRLTLDTSLQWTAVLYTYCIAALVLFTSRVQNISVYHSSFSMHSLFSFVNVNNMEMLFTLTRLNVSAGHVFGLGQRESLMHGSVHLVPAPLQRYQRQVQKP